MGLQQQIAPQFMVDDSAKLRVGIVVDVVLDCVFDAVRDDAGDGGEARRCPDRRAFDDRGRCIGDPRSLIAAGLVSQQSAVSHNAAGGEIHPGQHLKIDVVSPRLTELDRQILRRGAAYHEDQIALRRQFVSAGDAGRVHSAVQVAVALRQPAHRGGAVAEAVNIDVRNDGDVRELRRVAGPDIIRGKGQVLLQADAPECVGQEVPVHECVGTTELVAADIQ